jgi:hypothetical protein
MVRFLLWKSYGSGSDFLTSYGSGSGSGSTSQKVIVPTVSVLVSVPVPQHCNTVQCNYFNAVTCLKSTPYAVTKLNFDRKPTLYFSIDCRLTIISQPEVG